jgi:hypothetical protein
MKKIVTAIALVISLINFTNLFAAEAEETLILTPKYLKLSFGHKINSLYLPFTDSLKNPKDRLEPNGGDTFSPENYPQLPKDAIAWFSLAAKDPNAFSLKMNPDIVINPEYKKNYSKTALEVTGVNVFVWAYARYIYKKSWAYISFKSMLDNIKFGLAWDFDPFQVNQLIHPYHGGLHYSIAKSNGFNFFESTLWAFLGSAMAEFLLETRGIHNNPPSRNDLMMNTLGGITLGEVLFRTADLVIDESSGGLERAFRETLAFLINPTFGFRMFTGEAFRRGNPPEKHYYSLKLPFGVYGSNNNKPNFMIAASLEYKDFFKKNPSKINPYDWFTLDCRLGYYDGGFRDKEFYVTGVITGKKVKNGLAGLFGVFDYIDTSAAERMSAVGVGPGVATVFVSDSNLFFKSSGVLSLIFGGSSPSFDLEHYHFGKKENDPYYLGPGILGKIKLELGKKGLGSIDTGISQYWVHSMYTQGNEFLSIFSIYLKYDLSNTSQLSLGYDYYLRHATLQEQRFTGAKPTARALYVLKF